MGQTNISIENESFLINGKLTSIRRSIQANPKHTGYL